MKRILSTAALFATLTVVVAARRQPQVDVSCSEEGTILIGPPVACVEATFMLLPPYANTGIPAWGFEPPHNLDPSMLDPKFLVPNWCVHEIVYSYAVDPCATQALTHSSGGLRGVLAAPTDALAFGMGQTGFSVPPEYKGMSDFAIQLSDGTTVLRWEYQRP